MGLRNINDIWSKTSLCCKSTNTCHTLWGVFQTYPSFIDQGSWNSLARHETVWPPPPPMLPIVPWHVRPILKISWKSVHMGYTDTNPHTHTRAFGHTHTNRQTTNKEVRKHNHQRSVEVILQNNPWWCVIYNDATCVYIIFVMVLFRND